MTGPKIGLIDIETAPLNGDFWGLFDQNISLKQLRLEWSILSYTYKPLGGKRSSIVYSDTRGDPRNDKVICDELWQIMHDNDFLIAQNGKRFDMRKIRARMLLNGLPPPSPTQCIDTLMMARQVGGFTSNKLEWLSTYLSTIKKRAHKDFPGFELWTECLKDNPKAWNSMRLYNIDDVTSMEQVYIKLRPWANGHPNVATYTDDDTMACPKCGSHDVLQDGFKYTGVSKYNRYVCSSCGGWSHDRYTVNSKQKRRVLLGN